MPTTTSEVKDGKLLDARVIQKLFANLEHGDLAKVNAIVLHQTGGKDASSTLSQYTSASIGAHFLIGKDGTIYQTARVTKQCFHVGPIRSRCQETKSCSPEEQSSINKIFAAKNLPYSKKVLQLHQHESAKPYPARFPNNTDSIGIEVASMIVNGQYEDPTAKQAESAKWLVAQLFSAFGIKPPDVYRHPVISYKDPSEAQHVNF